MREAVTRYELNASRAVSPCCSECRKACLDRVGGDTGLLPQPVGDSGLLRPPVPLRARRYATSPGNHRCGRCSLLSPRFVGDGLLATGASMWLVEAMVGTSTHRLLLSSTVAAPQLIGCVPRTASRPAPCCSTHGYKACAVHILQRCVLPVISNEQQHTNYSCKAAQMHRRNTEAKWHISMLVHFPSVSA